MLKCCEYNTSDTESKEFKSGSYLTVHPLQRSLLFSPPVLFLSQLLPVLLSISILRNPISGNSTLYNGYMSSRWHQYLFPLLR